MATYILMKRRVNGKRKYQILAPNEIEAFRDTFHFFDKGGKGYITTKDIERVLAIFGETRHKADDICKEYDTNGDGKVTFDELLAAVAQITHLSNTEVEASHAFRMLDRNQDGALDKEEMRALTTCMGQLLTSREIDEIFQLYDKDKDGKLLMSDFLKMLTSP